MKARIVLVYLYRIFIQSIFNAVFNAYHYSRLFFTRKIDAARKIDVDATLDALCDIPVKMRYEYDGILHGNSVLGKWPCWTASRIVFAGMGLSGNCMDGAHYLKRPMQGRVKIWIPDKTQYSSFRWFAHLHYACLAADGCVWSLEKSGLKKYTSLERCRKGGRWI